MQIRREQSAGAGARVSDIGFGEADRPRRHGNQAEYRAPDRRLARARFTDQSDRLGRFDIECHAVDGTEPFSVPPALLELDNELGHFQEWAHTCTLARTSVAMQRLKRPGRGSVIGIGASVQASVTYGQRFWNLQPGGHSDGSGTEPGIVGSASPGHALLGVDFNRTFEYGCSGLAKISSAGACSTIWLAYMTATRVRDVSHDAPVMCHEQERDACFRLQVAEQIKDLRLNCDIQRSGRLISDQEPRPPGERTIAIATRCAMPPESSCG